MLGFVRPSRAAIKDHIEPLDTIKPGAQDNLSRQLCAFMLVRNDALRLFLVPVNHDGIVLYLLAS